MATEQALPAGFRIGAYEVVRLLGAGTFGNVYLCRRGKTGDLVAVREYMPLDTATRGDDMVVRASLPATQTAFREGLAVFRDRARRMESLDHPNLVRVREQLERNGTVYVVMDYAQGSRLSQLLAKTGTLGQDELAAYVRPVAESLMAMHDAGVVHGGLGVDSIVVTDEGVPRLLGLAVPVRDAFGTVAKPGFAAIEQYSATADLASPSTDVYSLGAVLYRCVTGLTPPEAPIRAERDTLAPAARARRGRGKYSARLLATIDAALAVDPEARPERVDALRDVLPAIRPPAQERQHGPGEHPSGAPRADGEVPSASARSPKVLLGVAAAAAVVVGVGLAALLGGGDGGAPSEGRAPDAPQEVAADPTPASAPALPQEVPIAAEEPPVAAETAPASGPEAAAAASLSVVTTPPGAEVQLDGVTLGETPLELDDLAPGTRFLSLRHPLYETMDLAVALGAGTAERVEQDLTRATGALQLQVSPEGAWVERGGQRLAEGMPTTLADLPAGPVTLTIGASGHSAVEVTAVVPKGGVESMDITLERAFGTLLLALAPADAEVELLDHDEPYSPGMSLAEGRHRLAVSRQGYAPATHTVEVSGATMHEITLERLTWPFTLAASPPVAAVSFQDGETAYTPGMELAPGEYELEVRLLGYESWFGTVRHGAGPTIHPLSLTFASHEYTDELPSGGVGPLMAVMPAGSFAMGCATLSACPQSELPVHDVYIENPFAMSKHEITFDDFDLFARATDRTPPDDQGWGRGDRPVINVSWEDATVYAEWLSSETGRRYRLPSEAEWEYAARAGSETAFAFGDAIEGNATCNGCAARPAERTAPVGRHRANAWGLRDMHGNVWEWTLDCSTPSYAGAPADGSAVSGGDCSRRVLRGGAWANTPELLRSATRLTGASTVRGPIAGFRLVVEIE